jgi:predicted SAM-dependent methyltransferase
MRSRVLLNVGCGAVRPKNWINTDSSINALIQKLPLFGKTLAKKMIKSSVYESDNVKYMNLNKYWKFENQSVDVVYASHIFEHLSEMANKIYLKKLDKNYIQKKKN